MFNYYAYFCSTIIILEKSSSSFSNFFNYRKDRNLKVPFFKYCCRAWKLHRVRKLRLEYLISGGKTTRNFLLSFFLVYLAPTTRYLKKLLLSPIISHLLRKCRNWRNVKSSLVLSLR